jgi:hypothetical protein
MKVSRQFIRDFAFLANHYQWTPADIEEIKADTQSNPDLVRYWTVLAQAVRSGYEQNKENGFMRLQEWCQLQGWGNPFDQKK